MNYIKKDILCSIFLFKVDFMHEALSSKMNKHLKRKSVQDFVKYSCPASHTDKLTQRQTITHMLIFTFWVHFKVTIFKLK